MCVWKHVLMLAQVCLCVSVCVCSSESVKWTMCFHSKTTRVWISIGESALEAESWDRVECCVPNVYLGNWLCTHTHTVHMPLYVTKVALCSRSAVKSRALWKEILLPVRAERWRPILSWNVLQCDHSRDEGQVKRPATTLHQIWLWLSFRLLWWRTTNPVTLVSMR